MAAFFDENGFQPAGATDKTAVTSTQSTPKIIPTNSNGANVMGKFRAVASNGTSAAHCYIEFGTATTGITVSTATSLTLLVPSRELIRIPAGMLYYSAMTDTGGTCDLRLTAGNGD